MEEKKQIKISLKTAILLIMLIILFVAVFLGLLHYNITNNINYQKIVSKNINDFNKDYEIISSYKEYKDIIEKFGNNTDEMKFNENIFEEKNLLVIYIYDFDTDIVSFVEKTNSVKVKITASSSSTRNFPGHIYNSSFKKYYYS